MKKELIEKTLSHPKYRDHSVSFVKRHQLGLIRPNGTLRILHINDEPEMTQQQFKDECDINRILKKFRDTGTLTHINRNPGQFLNNVGLPDFKEAHEIVLNAQNEFLNLPSDVRSRFGNSPQALIDFLADKKNDDEAVRLKLKTRPVPEKNPVVDELKALNKNLSKPKKPDTESV